LEDRDESEIVSGSVTGFCPYHYSIIEGPTRGRDLLDGQGLVDRELEGSPGESSLGNGGLGEADALHLAKDLCLDVGPRERWALGAHDVECRVGDVEQYLVLEIVAREGGHVLPTQFVDPRHWLVVEVGRRPSGPLFGEVPEAQTLLRSTGGEGRGLAKFEHFDVGGRATMIVLELGDQTILRADDCRGAIWPRPIVSPIFELVIPSVSSIWVSPKRT
jgi:hypothetical protein